MGEGWHQGAACLWFVKKHNPATRDERAWAGEMMRHQGEITITNFRQMFLLRGALLVVSCRANSNKSVSVRKAPGLGPGEGRKLEGNKRGLLGIMNFTERIKNGPDGFDFIMVAAGLVTVGLLKGKVRKYKL